MAVRRLSELRAILFDALGTLVALEDPGPRLVRLLRERHGIEIDLQDAARAFGGEIAHYRANLMRGSSPAGLAAVRRECAEVLRQGVGLHLDGPAMLELLLGSLRFHPYPDAAPALRWARARGLRTVCVSNWDISLHDVLGSTGLTGLLDGAVSSAEAGAAKPDPTVFRRALALAGCRPEQALHVGDSPREDGEGAAAAGIACVLVRCRGGLSGLGALPAALAA